MLKPPSATWILLLFPLLFAIGNNEASAERRSMSEWSGKGPVPLKIHSEREQEQKARAAEVDKEPAPKLPRFYRLASGPGYVVRDPSRSWGTYLTITRLQDALAAHHRRFPHAPPILIQDISSLYGGKLEPHVSHHDGRDVDIPLIQKDHNNRYQVISPEELQLERSWHLLDALIQTGDVVTIFLDYKLQAALYDYAGSQGLSKSELARIFQYPRHPESSVGIIRHEPGHDSHIHVRFRRQVPAAKEPVAFVE